MSWKSVTSISVNAVHLCRFDPLFAASRKAKDVRVIDELWWMLIGNLIFIPTLGGSIILHRWTSPQHSGCPVHVMSDAFSTTIGTSAIVCSPLRKIHVECEVEKMLLFFWYPAIVLHGSKVPSLGPASHLPLCGATQNVVVPSCCLWGSSAPTADHKVTSDAKNSSFEFIITHTSGMPDNSAYLVQSWLYIS